MERRNERVKYQLHNQRDNKIFLPKVLSKRAFQGDGKKPHISPYKPEAFLFPENAFRPKKKSPKPPQTPWHRLWTLNWRTVQAPVGL